MNSLQLALRNLLRARRRTLGPVLLIALALCGLDLFFGWEGEALRQAEQDAVFGERLGHLAILPQDAPAFTASQAQSLRELAQQTPGVILVAQAPAAIAVYLANPLDWQTRSAALDAGLRASGLRASLHRGAELSRSYRAARATHRWALAGVTVAALAAIMVVVFSTATLNRVERRREFALLRALGLADRAVLAHMLAEALLVTLCAVVLGVAASTLLWSIAQAVPGWHLVLEPAPRRQLAALVLVFLAVSLAVLVPALQTLRDDVAEGLAGVEQ